MQYRTTVSHMTSKNGYNHVETQAIIADIVKHYMLNVDLVEIVTLEQNDQCAVHVDLILNNGHSLEIRGILYNQSQNLNSGQVTLIGHRGIPTCDKPHLS